MRYTELEILLPDKEVNLFEEKISHSFPHVNKFTESNPM